MKGDGSWIIQKIILLALVRGTFQGLDTVPYCYIWKLPVPLKVKIFIWLAISNRLRTKM